MTDTTSLPSSGYERVTFAPRATASTTVTAERGQSGDNFATWLQSVDTTGVTHEVRQTHVTRTVYDLKDQVIEVYDARDLGFATWSFDYDFAGRRLVTAHATAS